MSRHLVPDALPVLVPALVPGLALVPALVLAPVGGTAAAWNDRATVVAAASTTLEVPPPATVRCTRVNNSTVRLSWSAVPDATGYTLVYAVGAAGGPQQVRVGPGTLQTDYSPRNTREETAHVVTERDFGSVRWTSGPSASVGYQLRMNRATCT